MTLLCEGAGVQALFRKRAGVKFLPRGAGVQAPSGKELVFKLLCCLNLENLAPLWGGAGVELFLEGAGVQGENRVQNKQRGSLFSFFMKRSFC